MLSLREYHLEHRELVDAEIRTLLTVLHKYYPAGLEQPTVAALQALALAHTISY